MTNSSSLSMMLAGITAATAGVQLSTVEHGGIPWFALTLAGIGAIGTVVGAITTYLSNQKKLKVDDAENLRKAQERFSQRMFMELGRLDQICKTQQEEIDKQKNLKHTVTSENQKLQTMLDEAQEMNAELLEKLEKCAIHINELEMKHGK